LRAVPKNMATVTKPADIQRTRVVKMRGIYARRLSALLTNRWANQVSSLDGLMYRMMTAGHHAGYLWILPITPLQSRSPIRLIVTAPLCLFDCNVINVLATPCCVALVQAVATTRAKPARSVILPVEFAQRLRFTTGGTGTIGLHRESSPPGVCPGIGINNAGVLCLNYTTLRLSVASWPYV
jgi:hypothetical protein